MTTIVSKSEIMKLVAQGNFHETFAHSEEGFFAISLMRKFALENNFEIKTFDLNKELFLKVLDTRVIEQKRVFDLEEKSWRFDPALMIEYPPQANEAHPTHLLIDGSHRLIRRGIEGLIFFPCYVFTPEQIIRPDLTAFKDTRNYGLDWGDDIINGKIVKRI